MQPNLHAFMDVALLVYAKHLNFLVFLLILDAPSSFFLCLLSQLNGFFFFLLQLVQNLNP